MNRYSAVLATALVLGLAGSASAEGLGIGDPAPQLGVKEFVKGDAVKSFEKDKTYVVEFWATWCGPCRVSIPHLTELQKKYKDVVFIGVDVWERDPSLVEPFVKKMGDKMGYRVATDDVPGADRMEGKMAKNWMKAAGQNGIPTAFVVQGGKIAWIGHPMSMDKPLAQIVGGKWDLAKAAADFKKAQAVRKKMQALMPKFAAARRSGDTKKLLSLLDDAIKDDPSLEGSLAQMKLQTLVKLGDNEKTAEYASRLGGEVFKDHAQMLNALAWTLVAKPGDKPDPKLMKVALQAARQADKLAEEKDPAVADTLARVYSVSGQKAKAVEVQERAVKLAKGTPLEKQLQARLESYKNATEK
jgi:thiol-disulfide isomerase/thioredoxin